MRKTLNFFLIPKTNSLWEIQGFHPTPAIFIIFPLCLGFNWQPTCEILTSRLALPTLPTLMRPDWTMPLWPWAPGAEALGANSRGGGPDPEPPDAASCCCCCCRRAWICCGDTEMGYPGQTEGSGRRTGKSQGRTRGRERRVISHTTTRCRVERLIYFSWMNE